MKKLFDSKVNKDSTCLSYALDRVGLSGAYRFVSEIPTDKFKNVHNIISLEKGDIVAWENSVSNKLLNRSIITYDGYPLLVQSIADTAYHLGVVEVVSNTYIIISDCTRSLNSNYIPELRLRRFNYDATDNDVKLPQFLIKL